jgi:hypothetical protein
VGKVAGGVAVFAAVADVAMAPEGQKVSSAVAIGGGLFGNCAATDIYNTTTKPPQESAPSAAIGDSGPYGRKSQDPCAEVSRLQCRVGRASLCPSRVDALQRRK